MLNVFLYLFNVFWHLFNVNWHLYSVFGIFGNCNKQFFLFPVPILPILPIIAILSMVVSSLTQTNRGREDDQYLLAGRLQHADIQYLYVPFSPINHCG